MARLLGISVQAVCNYRDGREIDAAYCPTIERATRDLGDVVTCEQLRSDVDWAALRQHALAEAANA